LIVFIKVNVFRDENALNTCRYGPVQCALCFSHFILLQVGYSKVSPVDL